MLGHPCVNEQPLNEIIDSLNAVSSGEPVEKLQYQLDVVVILVKFVSQVFEFASSLLIYPQLASWSSQF